MAFNPLGYQTYGDYATSVAQQYGIPVSVFLNQVSAESGWNPSAVSSAGAQGIAQILPSTAANPGYGISPVNPNDPFASLNFLGQYDAAMFNQYGNWQQALQAYNAGPGNVNAGSTSGIGYAQKILSGTWDNLLGVLGGMTAVNAGLNTPAGMNSCGPGDWFCQTKQWLTSGFGSLIYIGLGVVLILGALLMFANEAGVTQQAEKLAPLLAE